MRAIVTDPATGGPEVLHVGEVDDPVPGPGQVLIAVRAAGVNRADLAQREGRYPPPPGWPDRLGMEVAGEVAALGDGVTTWAVGDRVCALLGSGGYAELAAVDAGAVFAAPPRLSWSEAGALPEVFLTAFDNVLGRGRLGAGESLLVHGGSSGVGTAAIQLARMVGARVFVTVGSEAKRAACLGLGAELALRHDEGTDWVAAVRDATGGAGVDVILDLVGAPYLARNLDALAVEGRLVVISVQGGARAEIDLSTLMRRRLSVAGSTLKARSDAEKAALVARFATEILPGFADDRLRVLVDRAYPLAEAADAHRRLASSQHIGKLVLDVTQ